eukprot:CAMPEP_0194359226 /NCGR_PEP_ID=MMETSP0174-20130528/6497_1 /TAXON_ID=216777 /ORGANISM="Proboscia alata, Strain PI-D3" /LENGTH=198 /DNA_ID=CAMNT_0039130015 /DNA_START=16 /DNA_END=612 /DNA_ORIENTATION=-
MKSIQSGGLHHASCVFANHLENVVESAVDEVIDIFGDLAEEVIPRVEKFIENTEMNTERFDAQDFRIVVKKPNIPQIYQKILKNYKELGEKQKDGNHKLNETLSNIDPTKIPVRKIIDSCSMPCHAISDTTLCRTDEKEPARPKTESSQRVLTKILEDKGIREKCSPRMIQVKMIQDKHPDMKIYGVNSHRSFRRNKK